MSEFRYEDWSQIFPSTDQWSTSYTGTHSVYDRSRAQDVTPERIARIDAVWQVGDGGSESDLALLAELTDGTWATCMAWCDFTGWGCQDNVEWKWARTRDDAITFGLDREARQKLGVPLPSEAVS